MYAVLLITLLIVTITLTGCVLLQQSEGGALGIGGGPGGMMTGRSAANLLTRVTMGLGAAFMCVCIILAVVSAKSPDNQSVMERLNNPNSSDLPFSFDETSEVGDKLDEVIELDNTKTQDGTPKSDEPVSEEAEALSDFPDLPN